MTDRDRLTDEFEHLRPHLHAVAHRILGSPAEADDAVQDAWLRLHRSEAAAIKNLGGWLTTVVARLALDMLRTRATRREAPIEMIVPEPVVTSVDGSDPEHEALLADSIGLAMLVVLDTLSPAERLAFVLHDTFGLPFDQIAPIVDRSPTATRQLASRARRRVRGAPTGSPVSRARQRELVDAFLGAARAGDFAALLGVLDPEVVVRADAGATESAFGRSRVVRGADEVAHLALGFRPLASGARHATVNGTAGLVVFAGDRPFAVLAFSFGTAGIVEIGIMADTKRLGQLDLSAVR